MNQRLSLVAPGTPGALRVTVTSLELADGQPIVAGRSIPGAEVVEVREGKAPRSADLYRRVGAEWSWVDRLDWTADQWAEWTDRDDHRLLECRIDGLTAGYAELDGPHDSSVEIAYFGLLPGFQGRGLGGWFLADVLARARLLLGASRVWVHTCTLDGPHALANYRARGMRVVATDTEWRASEAAEPVDSGA